ncbi:monosaccharide importer [Mrakia frigida]|uniref:sugar porter family MFS transporter n=1 Tax=Mrakia frigida TaxID=29902 RepID=UPI003FCC11AB
MAGGPGGTGGGVSGGSLMVTMLISAFAAFGGILFGYDTGTISGIIAMEDWLLTFGTFGTLPADRAAELSTTEGYYLTTGDKSLTVSILSAGTFVGALLAYPLGDRLGRKYGLIVACVIFVLGVGIQLDTKFAAFIVGRVVAGLGVGMISCLVPMYQSECAPKQYRGFIVGLYQWAITIGLLLAAIVNESTKDRPDHSAWRIPIAIQFVWAFVLAGGMFVLPESPRFLLLKGRDVEARKALSRLTRRPAESPEIDQECLDISMALEAEMALGKTSYIDCFRSGEARNGLRTWTGILIQGMQQLTGINFIFYYGTTFFRRSGISNPFIITIITNVVNVVMTIPGILLIDRAGRRSLLLWGAVVMLVCEYLVAIVGVTRGQVDAATGAINLPAQRVLIAFVCLYIAAFASTWGPIAWVVTGEIFPLAIRGKAMSMSTASNWLWNFGIGYATPYLVDAPTTGVNGVKTANLGVKVFFLWGSTCLLCVVFTYFFVPETKGLSLEQVDLLYRESSIIKSNSYRKEMLARDETFIHRDTGHGTDKPVDNKHLEEGTAHVEHEKAGNNIAV